MRFGFVDAPLKCEYTTARFAALAAPMPSFELSYEEDEDVLEVTFDLYDEAFARTIPLNDHIFLFTDLAMGAVWGMTLYSFSRLLGVSETELSSLRDMPEDQAESCLALLSRAPASLFFDLTDPSGLIARVRAPGIASLIEL